MADAKKLCPTCHSLIASDIKHINQGQEIEGDSIVIPNPFGDGTVLAKTSTSGAVPQWSDDPLVTKNGLNGKDYTGFDRGRKKYITELQLARAAEEIEAGIAEDKLTSFSDISKINYRLRKTLIIELRQSVEKILDAIGSTLQDYFLTDADGNIQSAGPNDTEGKTDWTDVLRGAVYLDKNAKEQKTFILPSGITKLSPTTPPNTRARAIHFEDLRHPILMGWKEFWSKSQCTTTLPEDHIGVGHADAVPPPPSSLLPHIFEWYGNGELIKDISSDTGDGIHEDHVVMVGNVTFDIINPSEGLTYENTELTSLAFPTGFDIFPSDGGLQYIYALNKIDWTPAYPDNSLTPPEPQKIWIISGNTRQEDITEHVQFLVSYDPVIWVDSTGSVIDLATASANIKSPTDSVKINPLAHSLELKVHASSTLLPDWVLTGSYGAYAEIGATHNWIVPYPPVGDVALDVPNGFVQSFSERIIKSTMNTYFKFLVNFAGISTGRMYDAANNYPEGGGPSVPDYTNPSALTDWQTPTNLILRLYLDIGSNLGVPLPFYFKNTPSHSSGINTTKVIQAPFNGQTFTFDFGDYGIGIYLGEKSIYDEAININDLCAAYILYEDYAIQNHWISSHLFYYHNQKMEDPSHAGSYIADPNGSSVIFSAIKWILTAIASSAVTGPITSTATDIAFKGVSSPSIEATATIEALRIENNAKKVGDYV